MKKILIALTMGAVVAGGAVALALTDSERADLRAEIRAYLLDNPEVIMEAMAVLEQRRDEAEAAQRAAAMASMERAIYDDGYSLVVGNPEGDVTVVEFIDYNCGYCRRAHNTIKTLVETDPNIRYIIKEFPILGEGSSVAARAALAAARQMENGDYYPFHDALMTSAGRLNEAAVMRIARGLDLDVDQLRADMASDEIQQQINGTYQVARALNISGTPAFLIGDELAPGAIPLAEMRRMVDAARSAAE